MVSDATFNPDVLSCLANLSNDEVFTPPQLANQMLDLLPAEIWQDKNATFLDPACKTGVFLREAAKRLDAGLLQQIPDRQARLNHIFTKQLFGIPVTELTALMSRRSLYCSKYADGKYSVADGFADEQGNIRYERVEHTWQNGRCTYCGASEEEYARGDELETHAYRFIHTSNPEEIFDMKFDVIIGNPPYQLDTGGSGRQARPIYNLFIEQAEKLRPRYLTMIVPSRWFAGGMGLSEFREKMLNDARISRLVDHVDAREVFPGVDIAGGVCYFLWERDYSGECLVTSKFAGKEFTSKRPLNEFPTFVRHGPAVSILRKVTQKNREKLTNIISSVRPFGIKTNERPESKGSLFLVSSGGTGRIPKERVTSGHEMVPKWKVMTSKTSHDHAGQPDKDGSRRVLSRVEVLSPNYVCTESYIILGAFETEKQANNLSTYVKTRFVRFLVSLLSFSQDITRERFAYVPLQSFDKKWTDKELYSYYSLTEEEVKFIESTIRSME